MRRTIATLFGIAVAACAVPAQAEVTVMAVRLGANDVVTLAKFYEAAFGLKEIDRVGNPATEIIMRYGAPVAEAKASASPEFLVQKREASAVKDLGPEHGAADRRAALRGSGGVGAVVGGERRHAERRPEARALDGGVSGTR